MRKIITTTHRCDGFGAQYIAFISALAKARRENFIYRHTPIKHLGHFSRSTKACEKANDFIGMKSDEADDPKRMHNLADDFFNPPLFQGAVEYYTEEVLSEIREMYYSNPKPKPCKYDVAIHIRRGDITNRHTDRWIPNADYVKYIKAIKRKHPDYSICVYSEGEIENFKALEREGVFFKLNTSIFRVFHDFVTAKVLLIAPSAFSYTAALLSLNTIYYIKLPMSKMRRWKAIKM